MLGLNKDTHNEELLKLCYVSRIKWSTRARIQLSILQCVCNALKVIKIE